MKAIIETEQIGSNVKIGEYSILRKGVVIGDNVIIHPHVVIEAGVTVADNVEIFSGTLLGKPPKGAGATARPIQYRPTITIGGDCALGPNAVVYYEVEIGHNTLLGDGASLREQVSVGHHTLISRYVTVNYHSTIGDHTRIMDLTHITGNCSVGNNVFISIHVSTVNDNIVVERTYEEGRILGPIVEDDVTIGAGAILLPGVRIGRGGFVGAGALVTKDVQPYDLVMGIPAKVIKNLRPSAQEG